VRQQSSLRIVQEALFRSAGMNHRFQSPGILPSSLDTLVMRRKESLRAGGQQKEQEQKECDTAWRQGKALRQNTPWKSCYTHVRSSIKEDIMPTTTQELPKSYLSEAERQGLTPNEICLAESQAADDAGDAETSWAWLRHADLPAYSLMSLKHILGADFVRAQGFSCMDAANQAYGKDWLDR
jgi:hypothetical protein